MSLQYQSIVKYFNRYVDKQLTVVPGLPFLILSFACCFNCATRLDASDICVRDTAVKNEKAEHEWGKETHKVPCQASRHESVLCQIC